MYLNIYTHTKRAYTTVAPERVYIIPHQSISCESLVCHKLTRVCAHRNIIIAEFIIHTGDKNEIYRK